MPLIWSDWSLKWNSEVAVTDASAFGYGICTGHWAPGDVASHGRVAERGRFERRLAASARA
eukprot:10077075-Alexandrium_andersonii.AAC.1